MVVVYDKTNNSGEKMSENCRAIAVNEYSLEMQAKTYIGILFFKDDIKTTCNRLIRVNWLILVDYISDRFPV
ncbi:MAG: hypothetical protein ACK55I_50930, partial [bacterium]